VSRRCRCLLDDCCWSDGLDLSRFEEKMAARRRISCAEKYQGDMQKTRTDLLQVQTLNHVFASSILLSPLLLPPPHNPPLIVFHNPTQIVFSYPNALGCTSSDSPQLLRQRSKYIARSPYGIVLGRTKTFRLAPVCQCCGSHRPPQGFHL